MTSQPFVRGCADADGPPPRASTAAFTLPLHTHVQGVAAGLGSAPGRALRRHAWLSPLFRLPGAPYSRSQRLAARHGGTCAAACAVVLVCAVARRHGDVEVDGDLRAAMVAVSAAVGSAAMAPTTALLEGFFL
eukprot:gene30269-65176_t